MTHILETTICLPHDRQRATVMYVTIWSNRSHRILRPVEVKGFDMCSAVH